ncbi:hypothetical protein BDK51DRAFT_42618 [Blyttiomyces helicus]|uniref:Uncharacterized protein n=1 Tax=Blyttiomyces helicus TaxID=388810 RepID=A0A4P9WMJ8_9FUNG|nr:hypothetical protein BDK51DRAFT_42618 [Blyttiomyces helicus]|eukprot:RKO92400.1 hypothetical protein BDK51DRAFT_42618 [Blyttiomyces helicus]
MSFASCSPPQGALSGADWDGAVSSLIQNICPLIRALLVAEQKMGAKEMREGKRSLTRTREKNKNFVFAAVKELDEKLEHGTPSRASRTPSPLQDQPARGRSSPVGDPLLLKPLLSVKPPRFPSPWGSPRSTLFLSWIPDALRLSRRNHLRWAPARGRSLHYGARSVTGPSPNSPLEASSWANTPAFQSPTTDPGSTGNASRETLRQPPSRKRGPKRRSPTLTSLYATQHPPDALSVVQTGVLARRAPARGRSVRGGSFCQTGGPSRPFGSQAIGNLPKMGVPGNGLQGPPPSGYTNTTPLLPCWSPSTLGPRSGGTFKILAKPPNFGTFGPSGSTLAQELGNTPSKLCGIGNSYLGPPPRPDPIRSDPLCHRFPIRPDPIPPQSDPLPPTLGVHVERSNLYSPAPLGVHVHHSNLYSSLPPIRSDPILPSPMGISQVGSDGVGAEGVGTGGMGPEGSVKPHRTEHELGVSICGSRNSLLGAPLAGEGVRSVAPWNDIAGGSGPLTEWSSPESSVSATASLKGRQVSAGGDPYGDACSAMREQASC